MGYLLDTNAVIAFSREIVPVRRRIEEVLAEGEDIFYSAIVLFEMFYGARKSTQAEANIARLNGYLLQLSGSLDFTEDDARAAGSLRALLEQEARPIGPYDTLIAGQALARGMTLVTANVREFERVPGLLWQDWEQV